MEWLPRVVHNQVNNFPTRSLVRSRADSFFAGLTHQDIISSIRVDRVDFLLLLGRMALLHGPGPGNKGYEVVDPAQDGCNPLLPHTYLSILDILVSS